MKKYNRIDRTGEIRFNSFGTKMILERYESSRKVHVLFEDHQVRACTTYQNFNKGLIKSPYDKTYYGLGFIGLGDYKSKVDNVKSPIYISWTSMLGRCYNSKTLARNPSYKGCTVCEEWYNFQNYAKWYEKNYYKIDGEIMCLDKDIIQKGNKIYSPEKCVFTPKTINSFFVNRRRDRGEFPIGTSLNKKNGKYVASCTIGGQVTKNLGNFDTYEQAFSVYKVFKEKRIKELAEIYKSRIPAILYKALTEYKVEIDD
jgi:hypothetical protein